MSDLYRPNIPDYFDVMIGWRTWGIPTRPPPFGVSPKLYSVTSTVTTVDGRRQFHHWEPRVAAEATCRKVPNHVPGEKCSCGFYSAKSKKHLLSMGYHQYDGLSEFHVIGQVANWGKIREGTQGWRSQFSYPLILYIPFEANKLALPLHKAYGCKVELMNILK